MIDLRPADRFAAVRANRRAFSACQILASARLYNTRRASAARIIRPGLAVVKYE